MKQNATEADRPVRSSSPGRREDDFCPRHEENTKLLGKHSGQWHILLWILGLGIGSIVSIAGGVYYSQQTNISSIASSVHSIDKIVTAYIAGDTIMAKDGLRRIELLEDHVGSLNLRVNQLEK